MFDISGLNPQQKLAAQSVEGPLLILAGAGSGKTRTVTYRIAHMVANLSIDPKQILAVSFTNKAATEMHERVSKLLGRKRKKGITLSTFHSLALRILREDIHHLGYSKSFTIYDTSDQLSIVREALKSFTMEKVNFDKRQILSKIGLLKNNAINADEFAHTEYFDEDNDYDVAAEYVYHFYQDKLQFFNALDFDDILFLAVKLFRKRPDLARKYSERYRYIMIDEYQDTNGLQFEFVQALTSTHNNLCVVGDDDQSIYAFRGADLSNILNFEKVYPGALIIKLEQNYRSTNKILSLANVVIKENKKRKEKTMNSDNYSGNLPELWGTGDADHEAAVVIDEILRIQKRGEFLGEVALLYRSNTQVPPFEDALRLGQIPYTIIGGQKFYEKKEIKDLIAYISVMHNPNDELALRRILNIPHRGIGTVTLKKLLAIAQANKTTLYKALPIFAKDDSKMHQNIRGFITLIENSRALFKTMNLVQGIAALIDSIDYYSFIEKSYDSPKVASRKKDDVKNFMLSTERFMDRFKEDATLETFLERLLLADSSDSKDDGILKNEVQLMTLHASKGLEFDTVFMLGCEEELLPHKNTIRDGADIDEERRLFYVGVTRAKRQLFITHAFQRRIYGKDMKRFPSRFIAKVDEEYLTPKDKTGFAYMSEEEEEVYKRDFFNDLLSSLDE